MTETHTCVRVIERKPGPTRRSGIGSACAVLAAALLGGCADLPGDRQAVGPDGPVEVAELRGSAPAVVFVSGLAGHKEVWNRVFPVIGESNTVFAWDRPGIGRTPATERPRDGVTIVEELRRLLRSQDLPPPYVLVGHSAGGLYMQWYARRYPEEVAGLVLVDSTHPLHFVGEGDMERRSPLVRLVFSIGFTGAARAEFESLNDTGRAVLAAPPVPPDIPVAILAAPERSGTPMADYDNARRADLARLYPQAMFIELDCGHFIPQERPEAVIDAIRTVIASARRTPAP